MLSKILSILVIMTAVTFSAETADFKLTNGMVASPFAGFNFTNIIKGDWDFNRGIKLKAHLDKGEPVALAFFTASCQACKVEIDELHKIYNEYKTKGLHIYLVLVKEGKEVENDLLDTINKRGYTIPIIYHKYPDTIFANYIKGTKGGILSFPLFYVIDKQGLISTAKQGFDTSNLPVAVDLVKKALNKAL